MTNWMPNLSDGSGPLYLRLADRIEADITSGALPVGVKLPPQRNLAFDIGVTIGTVGRAYALVRERGLVSGEVGRGTFVLGGAQPEKPQAAELPEPFGGTRQEPASPGAVRMDGTAAPDVGQGRTVERTIAEITRTGMEQVLDYTRITPQHWREAGARWLARGGFTPAAQTVVPTIGVHAGVLSIIAAITSPGDRIAFEPLTYSSIARSGQLMGRRSVVMGADQHGADPEDFERLCSQQHPKLAFLIPSLQNPTLTIMPEGRRREIAEVARKFNVWLVEDMIYGALLDEQPPTIASIAPERTFLVSGLAKTVSAGARGGWVACPSHFASSVQTSHKMLTGGIPFLLAELCARLVLSGEADAVRSDVKAEIAAREALARRHFSGLDFASRPEAPYLWMRLPDPWLSGMFKQAAAAEGVLIDDEDEFKPGRTDITHHRARIAFSIPRTREEVERAFSTLRRLLDSSACYDSYG
ncbi:MAG: PLP-dependent aminotransferase family protein [Parvibaculaceae bacterium]